MVCAPNSGTQREGGEFGFRKDPQAGWAGAGAALGTRWVCSAPEPRHRWKGAPQPRRRADLVTENRAGRPAGLSLVGEAGCPPHLGAADAAGFGLQGRSEAEQERRAGGARICAGRPRAQGPAY